MEWKWKTNKYGRYKAYRTECANCHAEIWKRRDQIVLQSNSFCSPDCVKGFKTKSIMAPCGNCSKMVTRAPSQAEKSKSGNVYCSRSCATVINNQRHKSLHKHPNWRGGAYRKLALMTYGKMCQSTSCPFDNVPEKMLDVHHKDGNRKNNNISNLEVLCVWCHAVKTRVGW
jgi:hypothetical protein